MIQTSAYHNVLITLPIGPALTLTGAVQVDVGGSWLDLINIDLSDATTVSGAPVTFNGTAPTGADFSRFGAHFEGHVVGASTGPGESYAALRIDYLDIRPVVVAVPEPATWLLAALGIGLAVATSRARRHP